MNSRLCLRNHSLRHLAFELTFEILADLDRRTGWTMAAGLLQCVALFAFDTLAASWQAAMRGPEMMIGSREELARRQGRRVDDRDDRTLRILSRSFEFQRTRPRPGAPLLPTSERTRPRRGRPPL